MQLVETAFARRGTEEIGSPALNRGWRGRVSFGDPRKDLLSLSMTDDELTRNLKGSGSEKNDAFIAVYDELKRIALGRIQNERVGHTLGATALVNEAYLKLNADQREVWRDRQHFYAAAAEAMRRILIDHARKQKSQKRGGGNFRVTLGAEEIEFELDTERFLALNDALDVLSKEDERSAMVTRLRFFSGLSVEETATALEISERSVQREWSFARARLLQLLDEGEE